MSSVRLELIHRVNFTSDSIGEVRQRIERLREEGEISLKDLEKGTSYASSTWSQYLSNTYKGDASNLDELLIQFYRKWVLRNTIIKTNVVEDIHGFIEIAWMRRRIGEITGKFGRGKTKGASSYVAKHPEYAVMVRLTGVSNANELIRLISEEIGVTDMRGSRSDRLHSLIRNLQRKNRLIIIDEADRLKPDSLSLVQDIHGDDQANCGVILIGTDRLNTLLRQPELGYMNRRVKMELKIDDIDIKESKNIANMYPHDLDDKQMKQLWDFCKKHFGVGSLVNILDNAYDVMALKNLKKIDASCVNEAYTHPEPIHIDD
ncbi:MAG: AAA family ATPase [Bacteroidota bacterium]|jgi:DNA transposition AAA+ family ATPase